MPKKKITIEDLAAMTQRGFAGVDEKFTGTDNKIEGLRTEMNTRFNEINTRFDRIENLLLRAHENRLDRIEDDIRVLKTLAGKR